MKEEEITLEGGDLIVKEGYIIAVGRGDVDDTAAQRIKDEVWRLLEPVKGQVDYLVDLNEAGRHSVGARRIWQEINEHPKFRRVALVGLHPVARVLAAFVIGVARKKKMKFFKTAEEALAWFAAA